MTSQTQIFETQNVDLASFLMLQGIRLLEGVRSTTNRTVVIFRFLDEKSNCVDLERVFLNSEFKTYRDINKYLLGKVHEVLRS